ncbi:hypothetical protein MSAN_01525200 [Mycena sanguinolenta]|uniref:Uncharacterized protein n=1 Tax=Mycena sanguinolenta TaxID=230812 RepID=A0A8H7CZ79_9AGAR|nr:hypothetical protein MSAN_01525200 [Mycena sanguinolenta]
MYQQPHTETKFSVVSTTKTADSAAYLGAFFPNASGFAIQGGKFTINNNIYNSSEERPTEFRTILLGDIKLGKEIYLNGQSGVVGRQNRARGVRRMYSAEIRRDPGPVTVAMYQGHKAEESTEWNVALDYLLSVCPKQEIDYDNWSIWISSTTGQLCVDLVQAPLAAPSSEHVAERLLGPHFQLDWQNISLDDPDAESLIISIFGEDEYHERCSTPLVAEFRRFSVSTQLAISLGPTIFRSDPQQKTLSRITEPLDLCYKKELRWRGYGAQGEVMHNSWIRYDAPCQIEIFEIRLWIFQPRATFKSWMAQANHIFVTELEGRSHLEDYVCTCSALFALRCLPNASCTHDPQGYLFVCPPEDLRIGKNSFQWPAHPAYWSLDPSGADCLTPETADALGFPTIHIETSMYGMSWDKTVYDGLRRFHQGKGFDPDSQDIARHLGYPLFELPREKVAPVIYVDHWCDLKNPALCRELGHFISD